MNPHTPDPWATPEQWLSWLSQARQEHDTRADNHRQAQQGDPMLDALRAHLYRKLLRLAPADRPAAILAGRAALDTAPPLSSLPPRPHRCPWWTITATSPEKAPWMSVRAFSWHPHPYTAGNIAAAIYTDRTRFPGRRYLFRCLCGEISGHVDTERRSVIVTNAGGSTEYRLRIADPVTWSHVMRRAPPPSPTQPAERLPHLAQIQATSAPPDPEQEPAPPPLPLSPRQLEFL